MTDLNNVSWPRTTANTVGPSPQEAEARRASVNSVLVSHGCIERPRKKKNPSFLFSCVWQWRDSEDAVSGAVELVSVPAYTRIWAES